MKYLRLGVAWEYVLADLVTAQRQALIELTGKDLLPTSGLVSTSATWYGYDADDVMRSRVLVQERLSTISPLSNIVEPLARLSRAVDRGACEVYILASGFPEMYRPVRRWLDAWGAKTLPLITVADPAAVRAVARELELDALIHTRASYGPLPTSLLIDTPQFDQSQYRDHLVANLDAALARAGFEG